MRRGRRLAIVVAGSCACLAAFPPAFAAAPGITGGAAATAPAQYVVPDTDLVSVYQTAEITTPIRDAALAAAAAAGAGGAVGRGFVLPMTRVQRGNTVIQQASAAGYAFPMGVTALPTEAVRAVMGRGVAGPVSQGQVVMGQTSAGLRGAQAGDVITVRKASGGFTTLVIGLVAPDDVIRGTEIVMSVETAALVGGTVDTRVLIYGMFDRTVLNNQLAARGLSTNSKVRIRRSWDAPDPDSTLSMSTTKSLLGEFDIDYDHISTYGWTNVGAAWRNTYLPATRETYPTGIRAMCNIVVKADLIAALQEVVDSGLASKIDVANANAYGGCATGQARLSRLTQALGSVSRHSWGQPLDTNTTTNCQGCVPKMDCRVVRIFRKHHFAWGGNFLTPDGMHFEWVGEARDTLQYPSKYCPNLPAAALQTVGPSAPAPTAQDTFFAGDGLSDE